MRLVFIFTLILVPALTVSAGENSRASQFHQAFLAFLETEVAQDTPGFAVTLV
ncbi:MAG: hypothetical protein HKN08_03100, partial [Gammaproteobacteria bacterium]|nr:hypothetical protein [Gammaproteobacteria bacterium]